MDIDNIGDRFKEIIPKILYKKLSEPKYSRFIPQFYKDIDYFFKEIPNGFPHNLLHNLKHTRLSLFGKHDRKQTESQIRKWLWSKFNLRENREDWKKVSTFCYLFSQCHRFKNENRNYVELKFPDFRSEKCLIFRTKSEYENSNYYYNEDYAKRGTKGNLIPVIWIGKGWNQRSKKYKFAPGINCEVSLSGIMNTVEWITFRKWGSKRESKGELEDWYSKLDWPEVDMKDEF